MATFFATLTFPSNPYFLQIARDVISQMSKLAGLSDKKVRLVTLAVDEACANIIRHTYKNELHHKIEMGCQITEHSIEFALRDFGETTDFSKVKHRELNDVRPGGLGTFFMKNIMDEIKYENLVPSGNVVRLVKYLKASEPD
jgi:anti-sigma regulatory factor (Ser/Thr protein kinase)